MKIKNLLAALTLTIGITMAALPMTSYSQTPDSAVPEQVHSATHNDNALINISFQSSASLSIPVSVNNSTQSNLTFNLEKYLLMSFIATLMAMAIFFFI